MIDFMKELDTPYPESFLSSMILFSEEDLHHHLKSKRVDPNLLKQYLQSSTASSTGILFDVATTILLRQSEELKGKDELDFSREVLNDYILIQGSDDQYNRRLIQKNTSISDRTKSMAEFFEQIETGDSKSERDLLFHVENLVGLMRYRRGLLRVSLAELQADCKLLLGLLVAISTSALSEAVSRSQTIKKWISFLSTVCLSKEGGNQNVTLPNIQENGVPQFLPPKDSSMSGRSITAEYGVGQSPDFRPTDTLASPGHREEQVEFITDWQSIFDNASLRAELIDMITAVRAEVEMGLSEAQ